MKNGVKNIQAAAYKVVCTVCDQDKIGFEWKCRQSMPSCIYNAIYMHDGIIYAWWHTTDSV